MTNLPLRPSGQAERHGEQLPGIAELDRYLGYGNSYSNQPHISMYQPHGYAPIQRPDTSASTASQTSRGSSPAHPLSTEAKKVKERNARKTEATIRCWIEDMLHVYTGYDPAKTQTAGNGRLAGLVGDKTENALAVGGLLESLLCRDLLAAYDQDQAKSPGVAFGAGPHVSAVQAQMRGSMQNSVTRGSVLAGTLLDAGDEARCDHDPKSKSCNKHHTPDYRFCRREQCKRTFVRNLKRNERKHQRDPEPRGSRARNIRESRLA
ncbi:hypothetical protein LTR35_005846 [Friedmanniomyces endolithicus]|uniref:Uncharacterized protein n=1 Tax=Friedmanniomyces endolithicus TaxID=329885 RepID=A0AAN6G189_9PEZI|nr:hypothetical protein LTR35_005846 [Friedmanniomyces endolithicus]KAK0300638.1 hypothetical protein LTS00_000894 [Friedmanniomyces endolithicus]KAK0328316.1 hypothetical protein LTR82_000246 [Friedmanniomyces endolithicus]KAK1018156.1 hypothetical protein LTR54_002004 [Friedmanniomyces endolithicus]